MGAIKVFLKEVVLQSRLRSASRHFSSRSICLTAYATTPYVDLRWITIRHPEDVPLARSQRLRYLRLSRHLRIELNHRRSHRRTRLLHRAAARCHSYHPRNHLNYINEEGLFLLQFGVRSKPSFFVAQKPEYLLAMRRKKGVFKHETHDSR